jgi:PAS domain S-box-containing protein
VISDYDMPDMDGIEFLKRVRSENPLIPFVIFTGKGREEVVIDALNNGADFYLQKGGEPHTLFTELINTVKHLVRRNLAEFAAFQSEHRLKTFLNSLSDFAFIKDDEHRFIFLNTSYREFLGLSLSDDTNGTKDSDLLPGDLDAICSRAEEEVLTTSSPVRFIEPFRGRDFRFHLFPILFSEQATGIGGIIRDVTEGNTGSRVPGENLYRTITDSIRQPVLVLDQNGSLQYLNPAMDELIAGPGTNNQEKPVDVDTMLPWITRVIPEVLRSGNDTVIDGVLPSGKKIRFDVKLCCLPEGDVRAVLLLGSL